MTAQNIEPIALNLITVSHNPRNPARKLMAGLLEESYEGVDYNALTPLHLMRRLALSDNAEDRREYVRLMEKYEWTTPDGDTDPEGIVALADSIRNGRQIQPIMVRDFRVEKKSVGGSSVHETRYGLVVGERRMLACAFNHAKYGTPPVVMGTVVKMTVAQAGDLAWDENRRRANMTPMEVARYFHSQLMTLKGKPNTTVKGNRKWNMRTVAKKLGEDYQEFRRMEALVYLPEAEQRRLDAGKIGKIKAQDKAIRIKRGEEAEEVKPKQKTRRRAMSLKEVEALFDRTGRHRINYLHGLADVMHIDFDTACKESDARKAEADALDKAS